MASMPAKQFEPEDLSVFVEPTSLKNIEQHMKKKQPALTSPKRKQLPTTGSVSSKKRPSIRRSGSNVTPSSIAIDTLKLRSDRLGTLVRELASAFCEAPSWE